jgi:hypothetical protein
MLQLLFAAATPTPSVPTGDAAREIGPGFLGFVFTALLAVAVVFLIRDMVRRIRRVRYQGTAEQRQQEFVERGRRIQPDDDDLPPEPDHGSGGRGTSTPDAPNDAGR